MKTVVDTSRRTDETEIMDDFDLKGAELERTLEDLDKINKWLGGNKITLQGIKKLLKNHPTTQPVHIADVGCGNGAILREIAEWGRAKNINLKLTGIDANTHAIKIAEKLSEYYPEINFNPTNIFSQKFKEQEFDIVLCTLTLHHFKDQQIREILQNFYQQAKIGIVINDLHRSRQAYYLFKAFCRVFINNKIAKEDGLTSVLRGFKKRDLKRFSDEIPAKEHEINWKWAYRYQWIIKK